VQVSSIMERWKSGVRRLKVETYALYLAYRDPRVPWYAKAFAAVVVAYAFSPVDLVPDFIPVVGYVDDLVLVPAGVALALKMMPAGVLDECREQAQALTAEGAPVSRVAAAVVVLIWLLVASMSIVVLVRMVRSG
jgi:uncharacterized membrane protein YkvA (DUF1232 family)